MKNTFELEDAWILAKNITKCPSAVQKTKHIAAELGLDSVEIDTIAKRNALQDNFDPSLFLKEVFTSWVSHKASANPETLERCLLNLKLINANELWKEGFSENEHCPRKKQKFSNPELIGVPQRIRNFTGRKEHLKLMTDIVNTEIHTIFPQKVSITACHGLGGIGKTSLATEYIYMYKDVYDLVVWFNSENAKKLDQEIFGFAKRKRIQGGDEHIESVINWFEQKKDGRWLIIYDNVPDDESKSFEEKYFPRQGNGDIIITSRFSLWDLPAIELDVFKPNEFEDFFRQSSRTPPSSTSREKILELGTALGYLPLATSHALGYINYAKTTVDNYLKLFETKKKELLSLRKNASNINLLITWNITMERIKFNFPAAIEWIKILAYTYPTNIHRDLFYSFTYGDEIQANEIIGQLTSYSMIRAHDAKCEEFDIHRLVQDVLRINYSEEEVHNMVNLASLLLRERSRLTELQKQFQPQNRFLFSDQAHWRTLLKHFVTFRNNCRNISAVDDQYNSLLEQIIEILKFCVRDHPSIYTEDSLLLLSVMKERYGDNSIELNDYFSNTSLHNGGDQEILGSFESLEICVKFLKKECEFLIGVQKPIEESLLNEIVQQNYPSILKIDELSKQWKVLPTSGHTFSNKLEELLENIRVNFEMSSPKNDNVSSKLSQHHSGRIDQFLCCCKDASRQIFARMMNIEKAVDNYADVVENFDVKYAIILTSIALDTLRISPTYFSTKKFLERSLTILETVDFSQCSDFIFECTNYLSVVNTIVLILHESGISQFFEPMTTMLEKLRSSLLLLPDGKYIHKNFYFKLEQVLSQLYINSPDNISNLEKYENDLISFLKQPNCLPDLSKDASMAPVWVKCKNYFSIILNFVEAKDVTKDQYVCDTLIYLAEHISENRLEDTSFIFSCKSLISLINQAFTDTKQKNYLLILIGDELLVKKLEEPEIVDIVLKIYCEALSSGIYGGWEARKRLKEKIAIAYLLIGKPEIGSKYLTEYFSELYRACYNGTTDTIQDLLQDQFKESKIKLNCFVSTLSISGIIRSPDTVFEYDFFHAALWRNNYEIVQVILDFFNPKFYGYTDKYIFINQSINLNTPIHIARKCNNLHIEQLLKENEAETSDLFLQRQIQMGFVL